LEAVNATVYDDALVNVWLGFCSVDVPPSPKFHCQEVGFEVEVSVNFIVNGARPLVTTLVNEATGGTGFASSVPVPDGAGSTVA